MSSHVHLVCVSHKPAIYARYLGSDRFVASYPRTLYDNSAENIGISVRYNDFIDSVLPGLDDCWVMFLHHDMVFYEDPLAVLNQLPPDAIYGPVGAAMRPCEPYFDLSFEHRIPFLVRRKSRKEIIGSIHCRVEVCSSGVVGEPVMTPQVVDTLDCCCLIVHSSLIKAHQLRFDPDFSWHLYAEDFSLSACRRSGIATKVIPMHCGHYGYGVYDDLLEAHHARLLVKHAGLMFASTCCSGLSLRDVLMRKMISRSRVIAFLIAARNRISGWFTLFLPVTERRGGAADPVVPSDNFYSVGNADFSREDRVGPEFFNYFLVLADLRPHESVLDVGAGTGRMARALAGFLRSGQYEGIEIVSSAVEWCQMAYRGYPNFNFEHADVFSSLYNQSGHHLASEYRFPFESDSFDLVFLTSVFTHMLPEDLKNYLKEVVRVLKPGGRTLITYFLLNEESLVSARENRRAPRFLFPLPDNSGAYCANAEIVESAVAYPERFIEALYEDLGLLIQRPVRYGKWSGRKDGLSYQDIIVAVKPVA